MDVFPFSSPKTRRMTRFRSCVFSAAAVATIVFVILIILPSLNNRFEVALSNPRLALKEFPNTIQRSAAAGLKLVDFDTGINNQVDFTDAQFAETVEEQYDKIISSQKWLRQRHDWEEHDLEKPPELVFDTSSQDLTVIIFSAPSENDFNRQALLSWLHLSPRPLVVLLGNHSSLHEVADEFPGIVTVEPNIDYSVLGLPLFNSMVAIANAADSNVTVLVQPNVMLLQDFMPGLRKVAGTFTNWALVSQRLEITDLPFKFVHKGGGIVFLEHSVTGEAMIDREMANFVRTSGKLELLQGVNMWAWNVDAIGDSPLFASPMPSFAYGAGYHDQWMARGLANGSRVVVDTTDALVGFHVRDMADQTQALETQSGKELHNIDNLYLYLNHRDISGEEKDLLSGAWKLIGCPDDPSPLTKLCISETQSSATPCRCDNIFSRPVSGTRYAETYLEKEARLRLEVVKTLALGTSNPTLH